VRLRLLCTAIGLQAYLPPGFAARLRLVPEELCTPIHPSQVAFMARQATPGTSARGQALGTSARGQAFGTSARGQAPCNSLLGGSPVVGGGRVVGGGAGAPERGGRAGRAGRAAGPALRGRAAERLAALAEAERLAPWRQAIAVARATRRAVRDAKRAVQAGGAKRTGAVCAGRGQAGVVCHDPMQLSATPGFDRAGLDPVGLRSGCGNASRATGFGGVAYPSPQPWSASRPKPARGEGEEAPAPSRGASLLQREVAARAAGLRDRGNGQGALRPAADSALPERNPMQLSAVLEPATGEPRTGPPRACPGDRPGGMPTAPCAATPPASLVRFAAQALRGRGRSGLLSSTTCVAPMAHKVAVLVGLAGGWMGQVTIRATNQAAPDRPAWMTDATRERAAEDAKRLRADCMLGMGCVAGLARWDDLAGEGA